MPDKILRVHLDLITGASPEQIQQVMEFLHLEPKVAKNLETFINGMHQAFADYDAVMIEVNPVGVTKPDRLLRLDAKMSFNNNALYRHKEISVLQDEYEEEDRELKAAKYGFQYSEFDGKTSAASSTATALLYGHASHPRQRRQRHRLFLNVKGGKPDKTKLPPALK